MIRIALVVFALLVCGCIAIVVAATIAARILREAEEAEENGWTDGNY